MSKEVKKSALLLAIGGIAYLGAVVGTIKYNLSPDIELGLFLLAYLIIAYEIIERIAGNLLNKVFLDENILIILATLGAFGVGRYVEGVAVALFFQVGSFCEKVAVQRSKKSIAELIDIRPTYATKLENGRELEVKPGELEIGDTIVINPGERVPVDAVITKGVTTLDTKALTGEALPFEAAAGELIYSGSINLTGVIEANVRRVYEESTVSRIMDMVETAAKNKADSEKFTTRFAKIYTPIVLLCALAIAIFPPLQMEGDWNTWIYRGMIFLVAACPAGLVISIPIAFFGGIGAAGRRGVLVKSSNDLETLAKTNVFVFDKTGTVTKGVFKVSEVYPNGITVDELLEIAAHAEAYSLHPIAVSLREAYSTAVESSRVTDVQERTGFGISARLDGKRVLVGNKKLMRAEGIAFTAQDAAGTVVYVAKEGKFAGSIVITDEIKEDAEFTMKYLRKHCQATLVMLTGDSRQVGKQVAEDLDMDYCYTNLLPENKIEWLEEIMMVQDDTEKVAFIGDGINDAPVIARADVGIAMGALGSDAAIEAADIVLMEDEPGKIVDAIKIAKETIRVVKQNVGCALAVKLIVLGLSAFGYINMWEAICADIGVMILAIINAVWVVRYPW